MKFFKINSSRANFLLSRSSSLSKNKKETWRSHPALSSHRYSVIFSADSESFAISAIFRAVPADFNFDTSSHNWLSHERFWTSLVQWWTFRNIFDLELNITGNRQKVTSMKKAKNFLFIIHGEETRIGKIQNHFWWFF